MNNEYAIRIEKVNSEARKDLDATHFDIEHICKGGFRFITAARFDLEDRVEVRLTMPDASEHLVLGRICYTDEIDNQRMVYGFSILKGFYTLDEPDSPDPVAA